MSRRRTRDKDRSRKTAKGFSRAKKVIKLPHQRIGSSGDRLVSAGAVERGDTRRLAARIR